MSGGFVWDKTVFLAEDSMNILVAGLGLIGGSTAKALRRAGYTADGFDRPQVTEAAKREKVICGACEDTRKYDVVFVALPPDAAIRFIEESSFRDGAVVADFCGIKGEIERRILSKERNFRYVGCHPMAGKEVSGFENSTETLFDGASMIIVRNGQTDADAVEFLKDLYVRMGFSMIRECTAEEHDGKIAYTSQLAHIVSNAYVKSPQANGFYGFTGGSFQDMTRIAGVDEKIWTRLYMLNREAITRELAFLVSQLQQYLGALESGDEAALCALLREGRLRKEELDKERKII